MDIDTIAWDILARLAYAHVFPPRYDLFGILETAWADVQAVQHRLVIAVPPMVRLATGFFFAACLGSIAVTAFGTVPRYVPKHFFAVV